MPLAALRGEEGGASSTYLTLLGLQRSRLDGLKRHGGNEKRFGCPVLNLIPNRIVQTRRYIRPLLLNLRNVLPSEAVGRIV
jgi:hypothetical protein